jgi:predicted  nucleic acid-binding Zn-ribbon protein
VAGKIFINYRRGEDQKDAQHLATLLGRQFGDKRIFIDVRGIDGGDHWLHTLEKQVAASDAMVTLIGKTWLELKDEEGHRRLDNANDFVRFEIAQALQRDIPILPVLLDGTQMPKAAQLPPNIMGLASTQAARLRSESVVPDSEGIARQLKVMIARRRPPGIPAWAAAAGAVITLAIGVAVGGIGLGSFGIAPTSELAKARSEAERLRSAVQERDDARSALTSANRRIADLQGAIEAANGEVTKGAAERERLNSALAATRGDYDKTRNDLSLSQKRIIEIQRQIDAGATEVAQSRQETERLRSALAEALRGTEQAKRASENSDAKVVDLVKQLDTANGERVKARSDVQRLEQALATIQRERDQVRADITKLRAELEASKQSLADQAKSAQAGGQTPPTFEIPSRAWSPPGFRQ